MSFRGNRSFMVAQHGHTVQVLQVNNFSAVQQKVSVVSQVGFGQTCFPTVSPMLSHSQPLLHQHRSVHTASTVNFIFAYIAFPLTTHTANSACFQASCHAVRITGATVLLRSENRGGGNKPGLHLRLPASYPALSRRGCCGFAPCFYAYAAFFHLPYTPKDARKVKYRPRYVSTTGKVTAACVRRPRQHPLFPGCAPFLRVFRPHTG